MADVSGDAAAMDELLTRALREEAAFCEKYDPEQLPLAPVKHSFTRNWAKKNAAFAAESETDGAGV